MANKTVAMAVRASSAHSFFLPSYVCSCGVPMYSRSTAHAGQQLRMYTYTHTCTYERTCAHLPASTGTTHPRTGTTHPRTGTTHPRTGTTYPRTGTTHPRTGTTHPNPSTYRHNPPTFGHYLDIRYNTYCICIYRPTPTCMGTTHPHLVSFPGLRPVFISQPWRKINGCEIKSGCRPGNKAVKHSNNNIEEGDGPYSGIESAG